MYRQAYQEVDQDVTEAASRERNHEVDRMVTEAEFKRLLPNQDVSTRQGRCGGNPGSADRTGQLPEQAMKMEVSFRGTEKKERDDVDGVMQSRDNPNPVTYPLN